MWGIPPILMAVQDKIRFMTNLHQTYWDQKAHILEIKASYEGTISQNSMKNQLFPKVGHTSSSVSLIFMNRLPIDSRTAQVRKKQARHLHPTFGSDYLATIRSPEIFAYDLHM
jgi:hypothetical protein